MKTFLSILGGAGLVLFIFSLITLYNLQKSFDRFTSTPYMYNQQMIANTLVKIQKEQVDQRAVIRTMIIQQPSLFTYSHNFVTNKAK